MSNPETKCPFCLSDKNRHRPMVYRCESPIGIDPREWTSHERSRQCWVEEGKFVRSAIGELMGRDKKMTPSANEELETLRARVAELEGLEVGGVYRWGNQVSAVVRLPMGSIPEIQKTLGQAIPTKGTR